MIAPLLRPVNVPVFMLPADFAPEEILPGKLRKRVDDARWFLHTVLLKVAHGDTDEYGYARLDSRILRRVMSKRAQPAVVRALVDAEVIEPPAPYCAGVKAKGYKPTARTSAQRCVLVEAQDRKLIERIQREGERLQMKQETHWLPIHYQLREIQGGLTILPAADVILEGLAAEARLCQWILAENIRRRFVRFDVKSTGRVFNLVTGLKRELRKTLRLEGEPIVGVDIRCAQPALLGALMRASAARNVPTYKRRARDDCRSSPLGSSSPGVLGFNCLLSSLLKENDPPRLGSDFLRFESAALSGELYADIIDCCRASGVPLPDDPQEARERVKKLLPRDVIAKKGKYRSPFQVAFRIAHPSVHKFVRWMNRRDHGELIRALQRLESYVVIENVAPRLVSRGISIVTLHDAIYCRTDDVPAVVDAFAETFEELGVRLTVKSE